MVREHRKVLEALVKEGGVKREEVPDKLECDECEYKTYRKNDMVKHVKTRHAGGEVGGEKSTKKRKAGRVEVQENQHDKQNEGGGGEVRDITKEKGEGGGGVGEERERKRRKKEKKKRKEEKKKAGEMKRAKKKGKKDKKDKKI